MSWDPVWEQLFRERDWGRYPPEELIRFVARNFYGAAERSKVKILELGCGTGANIWYLAREGFDTYGVDGSATAIGRAESRMREEGLKAHLQVADAISLGQLFAPLHFDAVIDVTCLQHNAMDAVDRILSQVLAVLTPGGKLFSMMVASGSYGDGLGKEIAPGTYVDITEGPLYGRGLSHFFTLEEVNRLSARFSDVKIEESDRSLNNRRQSYKHWVVEATKRA
jgi:SAM-dependent methyltransferase